MHTGPGGGCWRALRRLAAAVPARPAAWIRNSIRWVNLLKQMRYPEMRYPTLGKSQSSGSSQLWVNLKYPKTDEIRSACYNSTKIRVVRCGLCLLSRVSLNRRKHRRKHPVRGITKWGRRDRRDCARTCQQQTEEACRLISRFKFCRCQTDQYMFRKYLIIRMMDD